MENKSTKPIDNVTVERLDMALRMCHIELHKTIIDKIIDLVELIEEKGGETSIEDICKLINEWSFTLNKQRCQ
jgi:hypothetical protein